jgi:hypothetical protein
VDGISSPGGVKNFRFSISSRPALGPTQLPIQWVPGARTPEVKRQGRVADNFPPSGAEVVADIYLYHRRSSDQHRSLQTASRVRYMNNESVTGMIRILREIYAPLPGGSSSGTWHADERAALGGQCGTGGV